MSILKLENICFSYGKKKVLDNVSYEFQKGKMYAVVGRSGAGKTTLLSVLSGLARHSSGTIYYDGKDIKNIDKYIYRSKYLGVIFQNFNLITKLTAVENIVLSMDISGQKIKDKIENGIPSNITFEVKNPEIVELLQNTALADDK